MTTIKTTTYTLQEFAQLVPAPSSIIKLCNITENNSYYVSGFMSNSHEGYNYIEFLVGPANSISLWIDLENKNSSGDALVYSVSITTTEDATTEDATTEDATTEDATTDNLDINAIADLCADLSATDLIQLSQKLQSMAVKKIKSDSKKTKVNKPETQTEKKERVSAKNFKYYDLLKSWHGVPTDKIIADKLNGGYSSSVINEDKRVINVLMGTDPKLEISQDWANYIIGYWEQNPDTTWVRLHYCFAKTSKSNGARDCQDIGLLCNYIVDNGVSKEDIEAAIASQIASQN